MEDKRGEKDEERRPPPSGGRGKKAPSGSKVPSFRGAKDGEGAGKPRESDKLSSFNWSSLLSFGDLKPGSKEKETLVGKLELLLEKDD